MAEAFMALQVVGAAAGTMATVQQMRTQADEAELQAKLADTQALQRDTLAREDLMAAESAVRAARGAAGMSSSSPNADVLFDKRRDVMDRDRLVARADDLQRAQNFRTAAASKRSGARWSLATGLVNTGVKLGEWGSYSGWFD